MSVPYIAVCGPGDDPGAGVLAAAEEVGALLAEAGAVVVTGGLGGVMEAACRGARSRNGVTVGLLPGADRDQANGWVKIALPTGLGELRNGLIVHCADALVAVGGGYGTLSEVALALRTGTPVVGLGTWEMVGVAEAGSPAAAAAAALAAAGASS